MTVDTGVPAFVVFLEDPIAGFPAISVGGGCGAHPASALYAAFEEAWAIYYGSRNPGEPPEPLVLPASYEAFFDESMQLHDRLRVAANRVYREKFENFLSGTVADFDPSLYPYPSSFVSETKELEALIDRVEALGEGYEVYARFAHHPILEEVGYFVAQVIVPQFLPLYLTECNIPLGAQARLSRAAFFLSTEYKADKIEPFPHPFP